MDTRTELWAKHNGFHDAYPLLAHLLDTATVAGALYNLWLRQGLRDLFTEFLGPQARNIVQCVVGLHDVGKAIPMFQLRPHDEDSCWKSIREAINATGKYHPTRKDSSLTKYQNEIARRHERWSALEIQGSFPVPGSYSQEYWLSLVLNGHHGRFTYFPGDNKRAAGIIRNLDTAGWAAAQHDLTECVLSACKLTREDLPATLDPTITILLSGITILADRIASGEPFVEGGLALLKTSPNILHNPIVWIAKRTKEAEIRIRSTVGVYSPWSSHESARYAILGSRKPRPIQQAALKAADGLWSLMATTGSGKTEAALLRHSTRNERLIFLLPTQATSNAIMKRVQKAYEDTTNVASLAHSLASIEDFYQQPLSIYDDEASGETAVDTPSGLYPSSFVRAGAARLFAPVCVGTVDQALAAALPGKWLHFRLLALANAHIVIDEVHTLDSYQTKLLEELLPWLAHTRTRVTFLTATMPSAQRELLMNAYAQRELTLTAPAFPAIDAIEENTLTSSALAIPPVVTNLELIDAPYDELISSHVEWWQRTRNHYPKARIGIICNTVRRTQDLAQKIARTGEEVVVLHSRMTAEHRRIASEKLLSLIGPHGTGAAVTVIGTQAIEASLDIDLDFLNSEICPAPSLIQRAGRLWRRTDAKRYTRCGDLENKQLTVTWITARNPWQHRPYLSAELRRTHEWLCRHSALVIPHNAQDFIDSSYVSFEDANSDEDFAALGERTLDIMKGELNRAPITKALFPESKVGDFSALTTDDAANEARTRLIDDDYQYRLILGSHNRAAVPGAWSGNAEQLIALHSLTKLLFALP
ncbi:CRISPR-associated helicase Cas3' [Arcanobacterium hippocoleae]